MARTKDDEPGGCQDTTNVTKVGIVQLGQADADAKSNKPAYMLVPFDDKETPTFNHQPEAIEEKKVLLGLCKTNWAVGVYEGSQ